MTNYESTSYHVEDENGSAVEFSTLNSEGATTPAEMDNVLSVGETLLTLDDVRGLQSFLNDRFGRNRADAQEKSAARGDVQIPGPIDYSKVTVKQSDLEMQPSPAGYGLGAEYEAARDQVLQDLTYYPDAPPFPLPKVGDKVHVVTATVTGHQPDVDQFSERAAYADKRQCPVIYNGVQCNGREGHGHEHNFSPLPTYDTQTGDGAATPPADQTAVTVPAADSATAMAAPSPSTPAAEKPKRKRRTKLEIAYDNAKEAHDANSTAETGDALAAAYKALYDKDPGNERLAQTAAPSVMDPEVAEVLSNNEPRTAGPSFAPDTAGQAWAQSPPPASPQGSWPGPDPQFANALDAPNTAGLQGVPPEYPTVQAPAFAPGQSPQLGAVELSPAEQQAGQAFPCQATSSDGRPCQRPAGHEIATPLNPEPKPHVYAANIPNLLQVPQSAPVPAPFTFTPPQFGGNPAENQATGGAQLLSFQVPPTPAVPTWQPPSDGGQQ